jgi:hypothetical protein
MPRFGFRTPSLRTAMGVTKATRRVKKATGITAATRPFRAPGNAKRRVLRKAGYESGPMKFLRAFFRWGR